ncbi:type IV secretion system protein [Trinickia violacea]|nr:type IV secretion system protein [Trinickia violacea]
MFGKKTKAARDAATTSTGLRAESYESIRVSRNRAWLLAVAAWPVALLGVGSGVLEKANEGYVPPVVLTIESGHVSKSEVGTPAVLLTKDAIIESELARYLTERFTLDRHFRDEHITYVQLHSSADVAAQFNHEMDAKNRENPYYSMPDNAVRRVSNVRIRILDRDAKKAEATLTTFVDDGATNAPRTYWHVLMHYDFVRQALTPEDRYVNGNGFVTTAFEKNTEPGPATVAGVGTAN